MAAMTARSFTDRLAAAIGPDLQAVLLYGSAVGQPEASRRGINLLVLVHRWRDDAAAAVGAAVREWTTAGHPAPLVLTGAEWQSSRDVFAMEHADIAGRHELLAGQFPAEPDVAREDLRRQLEYEAMGALLHLRQGLLAVHGDGERALRLLEASRGTVLAVMRGLLRVADGALPEDTRAQVQRCAALAGFSATPFERVVAHARGETPIPASEAPALLSDCHEGLQRLVAHVDAMLRRDTAPSA